MYLPLDWYASMCVTVVIRPDLYVPRILVHVSLHLPLIYMYWGIPISLWKLSVILKSSQVDLLWSCMIHITHTFWIIHFHHHSNRLSWWSPYYFQIPCTYKDKQGTFTISWPYAPPRNPCASICCLSSWLFLFSFPSSSLTSLSWRHRVAAAEWWRKRLGIIEVSTTSLYPQPLSCCGWSNGTRNISNISLLLHDFFASVCSVLSVYCSLAKRKDCVYCKDKSSVNLMEQSVHGYMNPYFSCNKVELFSSSILSRAFIVREFVAMSMCFSVLCEKLLAYVTAIGIHHSFVLII